MNIKKQLKQLNSELDNKILEQGNDVYNALVNENNLYLKTNKSINNHRRRRAIIISFASAFALISILSIVLFFPLTNKEEPVHYLEANQKSTFINEEIFNGEIKTIKINALKNTCIYQRIYDEISNDTLFYSIDIENNYNILLGRINIVTNKNFSFNPQSYNIKTLYKEHNLEYTILPNSLEDIPMNKIYGCIEIENIKVYFELTGIATDYETPEQFLNEVLIIN